MTHYRCLTQLSFSGVVCTAPNVGHSARRFQKRVVLGFRL